MAANPTTLTRAEKQARTREHLLDAAARVFGRRGYHAASLAEIGREAGHSTGAVYSNFSSKEELFLALADREVADRIAEAEAVRDAVSSPEGLGPEVVEQFRSFIARDPDWPLLFYEFWSYGIRNPSLRKEFDRRRRAVRNAFAEALATVAAQLDLELRFPAEELAAALSATLNGLAFERVADPDSLSDELAGFSLGAIFEAGCVQPSDDDSEGGNR
jgi:AcrR family transcriptional regulator